MRQSIWERDVEFPSFPKLEGDIKTDVLVIGGGLCGVGGESQHYSIVKVPQLLF